MSVSASAVPAFKGWLKHRGYRCCSPPDVVTLSPPNINIYCLYRGKFFNLYQLLKTYSIPVAAVCARVAVNRVDNVHWQRSLNSWKMAWGDTRGLPDGQTIHEKFPAVCTDQLLHRLCRGTVHLHAWTLLSSVATACIFLHRSLCSFMLALTAYVPFRLAPQCHGFH